ncbi:MAG: hypothetical protein HY820_39145 [Acidobacteria bacterium]|nr:hypothetical protein [Acidobacteriota bacterium]
MKQQFKKYGLLTILAGALSIGATGCATRGYVAYGGPPPPYGYVGRSPGVGYVWVDGYYQGRGAWVRPPHRHSVWVPGRFDNHGHHRRWVHGHWR